jgi:flavin-binding protein dodecin
MIVNSEPDMALLFRKCSNRLPRVGAATYSPIHTEARTSVRQSAYVFIPRKVREDVMAESVYKIIEIVGTSPTSWEKAASAAVERAATTLRDLRIAEVSEQDIVIADGKVESYRVRLKVSFKYED